MEVAPKRGDGAETPLEHWATFFFIFPVILVSPVHLGAYPRKAECPCAQTPCQMPVFKDVSVQLRIPVIGNVFSVPVVVATSVTLAPLGGRSTGCGMPLVDLFALAPLVSDCFAHYKHLPIN